MNVFPQSVKDWAMHSFNSVHGFSVSWPLAADWRGAGLCAQTLKWRRALGLESVSKGGPSNCSKQANLTFARRSLEVRAALVCLFRALGAKELPARVAPFLFETSVCVLRPDCLKILSRIVWLECNPFCKARFRLPAARRVVLV